MHGAVGWEIESYYHKPYYRPVLGNKGFVQWVMEKVGKKAEVDRGKPESRRVFGLELEAIVKATAKVYGKSVSELQTKRRGEHNEARAMAMYLGRTLAQTCRDR